MSANSFDTNSFWLHVKYPVTHGAICFRLFETVNTQPSKLRERRKNSADTPSRALAFFEVARYSCEAAPACSRGCQPAV